MAFATPVMLPARHQSDSVDTSNVIELTHRRVLCAILLGLWLAITPFVFGDRVHDRWYMHATAEPGALTYKSGQQRGWHSV